jgi:hypothetical protein
MKRSSFVGVLVFVLTLAAIVSGSRNGAAAPQAQKKSSPAKSSAAKAPASSPGKADLTTAWRNLARAYMDLKSTSPDVKGDTSRLEAAIAAAVDDLHQQDSSFGAASKLGRADAGDSRASIFNAVDRHLATAKKAISDSGIKSQHCEQAIVDIGKAQTELNVARTAPVKK